VRHQQDSSKEYAITRTVAVKEGAIKQRIIEECAIKEGAIKQRIIEEGAIRQRIIKECDIKECAIKECAIKECIIVIEQSCINLDIELFSKSRATEPRIIESVATERHTMP
jgi:hypothetical protein